MLQAWLSIGYIVLLAILVLAFILWRRGAPVLAITALVVGIPLWFGWEYARPTWTTGVITGTQVRRSDPDARGNTTDIQYIYMRIYAQPVRQGARANQRRFLVVVEARRAPRSGRAPGARHRRVYRAQWIRSSGDRIHGSLGDL
jgi:hypothetical protein